MSERENDVVVVGAGLVGRALALALAKGGAVSVGIVEGGPARRRDDGRASAVAAGPRRMLEQLGIWARVEAESQPILDMVVTDGEAEDVVRPVFLTFDGRLESGEPFAHMVPNAALEAALAEALDAAGVETLYESRLSTIMFGASAATVRLESGETIRARLVVGADGVRSPTRTAAGIGTVGWTYDQKGLVATITHSEPHAGRAEEHFLPSGPFALLPLKGNRSSLVWTERTRAAERLLALSAQELQTELARRVPPHYGEITELSPVAAYPLALTLARDYARPRVALAGDAAHSIHPLAGQGLNLGLKDVAALAEVVTETARLGLDIGALDALARYQRWRRFDAVQYAAVTDGLNRLFGTRAGPVRFIRDVGLGFVDRLPRLKQAFIGEAAGLAGSPPRLLSGEPL